MKSRRSSYDCTCSSPVGRLQATALRNGNALCDGISNSNWVGQRPRPSKCVKPSPHWKGMKDLETMWCIWSENGEIVCGWFRVLEKFKISLWMLLHRDGIFATTRFDRFGGQSTQPVVTSSGEESMEGTPAKPAKARSTTLRKIPRGVEWMPRKWMCLGWFFGGTLGEGIARNVFFVLK